MLTREQVQDLFWYDESTGKLFWKKSTSPTGRCGREAGWLAGANGRRVKVDGRAYLVHRVIWLLTHGDWPEYQTDHIDGNPLNNRLSNLRDVDCSTNQLNRKHARLDSNTGLKGVVTNGHSWYASIKSRGQLLRIKCVTKDQAMTVRNALEQFISKENKDGLNYVSTIEDSDWRKAATEWLERRECKETVVSG